MENKTVLAGRLDNIIVFLQGIYLLLFPLLITTVTTDAYVIPKQAGIALVVLSGLVILGLRSILTGNVRIRRTPFDLPLLLFAVAALLSSIFAVNRADSLISFVPFLFAILFYFVITNTAKKQQDINFLTGSLIVGSIIVSVITLLSYLKIYILPFPFAKVQTFTTFGSLFDQALFLILILSLCLYMAFPSFKKESN
jgi:hypothetical protein